MSFSGLTGALYVWQLELLSLFEQDVLKIPDDIIYKDYYKTAKNLESVHIYSLVAIKFPERERQTIRLDFINGDSYYYHQAVENI